MVTYNLENNISVVGGKFTVDAANDVTINATTVAKGTKTAVIYDKKGRLIAGKDGQYSFTALSGGEFSFKDNDGQAAIQSFDASAVSSGVSLEINNGMNTKWNNIVTGYGKDSILQYDYMHDGYFDLGAGNDLILFAGGTATITLGEGKDTVHLIDNPNTTVKISDYSYADDTVDLYMDDLKFKMDYEKSMFTFKGSNGEFNIATTMNNGVYELKLIHKYGSFQHPSSETIHFVRTDVSSVDYVAKDTIDFESAENTTSLNLTLADKTNSSVKVGATSGTVNIVAGKAGAKATSIDIGAADVALGLGISKKSGEVALSVAGKKAKLDENDTLYLADGGKLDELKFDNGKIEYAAAGAAATAKITNAYDKDNEGAFNYNINGKTGVLRYGNASKVTYTKGVNYYANAATVDASEYGDVVLNLNGVTEDAFAAGIKEITGVTSGLVAGRNNVDNSIKLATEANKKTEVYGGVGGADTIDLKDADNDSTNVIWYSNGDGKDTVNNFQNGNNSIYFHDATAAASVLNDALTVDSVGKISLTLAKGKDVLTLDKTAGKTIDFKDAAGNNFKVAVGDGTTVNYAAGVNIYKGATTLKVSGSDDLILYTGANNDQYGYFNGITKIDATEAKGTVALSGSNVNGMEI